MNTLLLQPRTRGIVLFIVGFCVLLGALQPTPRAQAETTPHRILLITSNSAPNPFGPYLGEILTAEGFPGYEEIDLSDLLSTDLSQYRVLILAETSLSGTQASALTSYVNNGGRLVA